MELSNRERALKNAPSREIFEPMFKARWQNMQNIINDSAFIDMIPTGYKTYYIAYIREWQQWSSGFVLNLHSHDFFSTGMGYTVCDIFTKECMSGGFRIHSDDESTNAFMEQWNADELNNVLNRMFFYSNSVGNAILVLTPADGQIYASVYPVNRVVFQIGRSGKISQIMILNRFVAGDSVYYARDIRMMLNGVPYYKVELAKGTLVTAPTWGTAGEREVPSIVRAQWEYCYGDIRPGVWYRMPERMRNIGCYNVRNKSVAVALQDLPGYSDSTLHTALDVLYSIDYNYTQGQVDQYLGKSRTIIPKQMNGRIALVTQPGTLADGFTFREAVNTRTVPLEDIFYTELPDTNLNGEMVKPTFIQPDLRGEAHRYIRDADLELLASKVGLSSSTLANHLSYNSSGTKTDDEVASENSTTEKSVSNKRELANTAINAMLSDVAYFYGFTGEVGIQWGRASANSARENQELLEDYRTGTLPLRDYLRKRWPDLGEEEVENMATEIERQDREKFDYSEEDYARDLSNGDSEPTAQFTGDSAGRSGNKNQDGSER